MTKKRRQSKALSKEAHAGLVNAVLEGYKNRSGEGAVRFEEVLRQVATSNPDGGIAEWKTSAEAVVAKLNQSRRSEEILRVQREALSQMLFRESFESYAAHRRKPVLDRKKFLRRLLPNDSTVERQLLVEETFSRMNLFVEILSTDGRGWPTSDLTTLLDRFNGTDSGNHLETIKDYLSGEIDLKIACMIAPVILIWRNLKNSPKLRGEKAHRRNGITSQA